MGIDNDNSTAAYQWVGAFMLFRGLTQKQAAQAIILLRRITMRCLCDVPAEMIISGYNGFRGGLRYPPKEAEIRRFSSQLSLYRK